MPPIEDWSQWSDEALFAEILARRGHEANVSGKDVRGEKADHVRLIGVLLERWRRPALYIVRRIQQSYRRGTPDDEEELFQDAVVKLIDRGLDQFRGTASDDDGTQRIASARTFFLRIVKHTAIDHYRKHSEELAAASPDGEELETTRPEADQATHRAKRATERGEAHELYWRAFERLKREHPNEAQAWDLYNHEDLDDHEACAKALGISVANSYKRISRAQAHLRLFLLELQDEWKK